MSANDGGQESSSKSVIDFRRRVQIVESYEISFQRLNLLSKKQRQEWHEGKIIYYKTDRKVILFDKDDVKIDELFNKQLTSEAKSSATGNVTNSIQDLANRPTLSVGQEFQIDGEYNILIEAINSIEHRTYEPANQSGKKPHQRQQQRRTPQPLQQEQQRNNLPLQRRVSNNNDIDIVASKSVQESPGEPNRTTKRGRFV